MAANPPPPQGPPPGIPQPAFALALPAVELDRDLEDLITRTGGGEWLRLLPALVRAAHLPLDRALRITDVATLTYGIVPLGQLLRSVALSTLTALSMSASAPLCELARRLSFSSRFKAYNFSTYRRLQRRRRYYPYPVDMCALSEFFPALLARPPTGIPNRLPWNPSGYEDQL